jgi:osmotically-inducible protein OsmY
MNDETLADKVESELFRDPTIPKGSLNVNAEHGTVVLRGTAKSRNQIERIMVATIAIDGVQTVRSLMQTTPESPPRPTERHLEVVAAASREDR